MAWKGTVETLGDLKDHGMGLHAHCMAPYAGHGARLDLDKLIEQFGAGHVFVGDDRIERACVCKQCGHKGAKITVIANTKPTGWVNPYIKAKGV
jgi:hypothetical protein